MYCKDHSLRNYDIKRNCFYKFLEFVFIIFSILQANSIYFNYVGIFRQIIESIWQITILLLFILSLSKIKNKVNNKILVFISIFVPINLLGFFIEYIHYKFGMFLFVLMIFDMGMLVVCFHHDYIINNINSILFIFEDIMVILSVLSVIFWIISILGINPNMSAPIHFGVDYGTKITSIPGYYGLDFIAQGKTKFLGMYLLRNTGIFIEAPIYSSLLNISLLIELFIRKNKRIFTNRAIILIVTTFSTTSTNGILIMIPACLCAEVLYSNNKHFVSLLILSIFLPLTILFLKFVINSKIDGNYTINSSYGLRTNDFLVTFNAWKSHPIIGYGIGNNLSILNYMSTWRLQNNISLSTGLMRELYYGGLLLILYYLIPIIGSFKISKRFFMFSLLLLILFIIEGIDSYYIFLIILSYLWTNIVLCKKDG